jgi:hypothetical protein
VNEWRNKESVKEERREGGNQKMVQKAGEQVKKTLEMNGEHIGSFIAGPV